jgi:DNA-binding MarR family transcriptional regulator
MSTTGLQPALFELLLMLIEPILDEVFPDETAAARMQQIGVFTLIFALQASGQPVTAARLTEVSGLAQPQVHKNVQKLLKVGVIERTAITSPHGRGRAWHLSIKHSPKTEKLAQLLLEGGKASTRKPKG